MTSRDKNWALWGAGLVTAASIFLAPVMIAETKDANAADATAAAPPQAVPVTVAAVDLRDVTTWQEFSGRLEAVERVRIRPRVAGVVQSVHFREGGLVKAGDLMVTIDPEPYAAAVAQNEGLVASAAARVQLAQTELDRGTRLSANKTISQSDMAQRQSAASEAAAGLQSAKAALKIAQLNLDYTQIRAPISGRAGKIEISVGNLVAAGSASDALTTVVSVDPIYASFDAGEDLVTRALSELPIVDGAPAIDQVPVEISTIAEGAKAIRGRLQLIDNEVGASSGTIRLRAVFDNPGGRLLPGQFVRVRVGDPKSENRLMISDRAVGTDQDKKFVFVVGKDNTVAYREVQLGTSVDGMRIVEKGLESGENIVVNGLQRIRPGALVAPETEAKVAQQ